MAVNVSKVPLKETNSSNTGNARRGVKSPTLPGPIRTSRKNNVNWPTKAPRG